MTTAESEVPPTALISWAHAPNVGVTTDVWRRRVLELAIALRAHGVDADLDLFHLHERGVDWTRWGPQRVITADVTIVVVNKAWRERFEGFNDPHAGAGAAAEASVLLGIFNEDQERFRRKVLLVVLPGAGFGDVPAQLQGQYRAVLENFRLSSLEDLLRILFDAPLNPMPPIGKRPPLPPEGTKQGGTRIRADREAQLVDVAVETVRANNDSDEVLSRLTRELNPRTTSPSAELRHQPTEGNDTGPLWPYAESQASPEVEAFLRQVSMRNGLSIAEHFPRASSTPSAARGRYVRVVAQGVGTVGYLYARGRFNPRVSPETFGRLAEIAPQARRVKSSNPRFTVAIDIVDEESGGAAMRLIEHATRGL